MKEINFPKNSSVVVGKADHNTRGFNNGEPCVYIPERILLDKRYSLAMRALAGWVWGQSVSWVFKVEDIQSRLGLTRGQWRTLVKEMTDTGFVSQLRDQVDGGVPIHVLQFNFTIFQLQTARQPVARGVENNKPRDSNNQISKKTPPAPIALPHKGGAVHGEYGEVKALAVRLGLEHEVVQRFATAAQGAAIGQLEILESIFMKSKKRDAAAFAIYLAGKAVKGLLVLPSLDNGQKGEIVSKEVDAVNLLGSMEGTFFIDPLGPVFKVEMGRLKAIRQAGNPFLHPREAARVVEKWQQGGFDTSP